MWRDILFGLVMGGVSGAVLLAAAGLL